jgi:hypothetical protein
VTLIVADWAVVLALDPAAQFNVAAPVPAADVEIVSHAALLAALHVKVELLVEIDNEPVPPEADTFDEEGLMVNTAAACVTVKTAAVPLAGVTVMVAVRVAAVGLPVALYWKLPFPVPVAPDVMVSHVSLDTAVQGWVEFDDVTVMVPLEMEAGAAALPGLSEIVPVITPASWLMEKRCAEPPEGVTEIVADWLVVKLLAAALHWIEPGPVPWPPDVMVTQLAFALAVHFRAGSLVVSVIAPDPPDAGTEADAGLMLSVPPDCVRLTVWAGAPWPGVTVMVAVRAAAEGLAVSVYWTAPLPVPLVVISWTRSPLLVADQVRDALDAVTWIDPVPPGASVLMLLGLSEIVGGGAPAAWVMVNVCPTPLRGVTVITAVLALPVLAAAIHCTDPEPIPDAPAEIVTQAELLVAVHWSKESPVDTVIVPLSPAGFAFAEEGLMLKVPPVCVTTSVADVMGDEDELTVRFAVLVTPVGFAATEYVIVVLPPPVPVVGEVIVTHVWSELTVHGESPKPVAMVEPEPPVSEYVAIFGWRLTSAKIGPAKSSHEAANSAGLKAECLSRRCTPTV